MNLFKLYEDGFIELEGTTIKEILTNFDEPYFVDKTELIPNKKPNGFKTTLSSSFQLDSFPFHTDGAQNIIPPKWIILEYTGKEKSETGTLLFDSYRYTRLVENENLFLNEIYIVRNGNQPFLTSLINKQINGKPIFRWNNLVMKKLINKTNKTLDDYDLSLNHRITWTIGKVVIIDNWRMLHSREKLKDGEEFTRKIQRFNLTPFN